MLCSLAYASMELQHLSEYLEDGHDGPASAFRVGTQCLIRKMLILRKFRHCEYLRAFSRFVPVNQFETTVGDHLALCMEAIHTQGQTLIQHASEHTRELDSPEEDEEDTRELHSFEEDEEGSFEDEEEETFVEAEDLMFFSEQESWEYENEQESSFSEWEMLDGVTFHKEEVQSGGWRLEARFSEEDDEDEDSMFCHEEHCSRKFSH